VCVCVFACVCLRVCVCVGSCVCCDGNLAPFRVAASLSVRFEEQDITTAEYGPSVFDIIYSRDCIMHLAVEAKAAVFASMFMWAKPGARVLISDYCRGVGEFGREHHWATGLGSPWLGRQESYLQRPA
jgi:SAM-dependent methyltransferase